MMVHISISQLKPIFEEDAMRKELTFNHLQLHDTGSIQSTANIKANGFLSLLLKLRKPSILMVPEFHPVFLFPLSGSYIDFHCCYVYS
jgi:hypothetical protein